MDRPAGSGRIGNSTRDGRTVDGFHCSLAQLVASILFFSDRSRTTAEMMALKNAPTPRLAAACCRTQRRVRTQPICASQHGQPMAPRTPDGEPGAESKGPVVPAVLRRRQPPTQLHPRPSCAASLHACLVCDTGHHSAPRSLVPAGNCYLTCLPLQPRWRLWTSCLPPRRRAARALMTSQLSAAGPMPTPHSSSSTRFVQRLGVGHAQLA